VSIIARNTNETAVDTVSIVQRMSIDIHKILTIIPFLKLVYLTFYLKIKKKQAKYSLASLIIRNSNTLCISLTKIINQVYFDYFVLFSHSLSFSVISWLQARNMEKVIL